MADDLVAKEYFTLADTVRVFDERLMMVKGWGITLSLASIGLAFQSQHYGLFLVASLSGLAFWALEGAFKEFQMRYYVRMREIEVRQFELTPNDGLHIPAPQIDWSWQTATDYFSGKREPETPPPAPQRYGRLPWYRWAFLLPQVFLPHAISVVAGGTLFIFGYSSAIRMPL